MKYKKLGMIIGMVLWIILSYVPLSIHGDDRTVIRVAYPIMNGLSMKDQDGNYYGYDYDFLMEIAQYTGWEYEFVEVEGDTNTRLTTMMQMLKDGELDLMGDTKYVESLLEVYDYASEPYGNAYNIIAVPSESSIMDYTSLSTKKNLKIAILESSSAREEKLKQYTQSNGISYERVPCKSTEEMVQAVHEGKADALLSVDLSMPEGFYSIARFSPDPFYFVTTKGNSEIIMELNQALTSISQSNPTLASTLYNQYFSGSDAQLVLNENELKYVKEHPVVKVLSRDGNAPVQYIDQGELKGIGKDILTRISEQTGIQFEYYVADSYEEYQRMIEEDSMDILMGVSYEPDIAERFYVNLSNPYLVSDLILVTNENVSPNELDDKVQGVTNYSEVRYDKNENLERFDCIEDVLLALNKGSIDYAYMNTYQATYYKNKYHLKNVASYPVADYLRSQYSFGVAKTGDLSLLSLMNKAIRSMDDEVNTYIYSNAYVEKDFDLFAFIEDHVISLSIGFIASLLVVFYLIRQYYRRQLKMKKAVELEYQRYQSLSDITGEMMFSYDYIADEFKVSSSGVGKLAMQAQQEDFTKVAKGGIQTLLARYLLEEKDINEEMEIALLDDVCQWYSITMKVIFDIDKTHAKAIYAIGKVLDIEKEKQVHAQLIKKSQSDILTGILNRAGAREHINNALLKEEKGALIMLDLDYFKDVNDRYGHISGDEVLIQTARLLTNIYQGNIIARLGGDEFIIYLHEAAVEQVTTLCEQAVAEISCLPCMKDKDLSLTMSMGIVYTKRGDDLTSLISKADEGLYEIKRHGKNGFFIISEQ